MNIVHIYDGHEKVHGGRGSVPGVVWNIARETAAAGHDVTVIERQWTGLAASSEHDGVRFKRLNLRTGANEPWRRVPHEMVKRPRGVAELLLDRTNFARAAFSMLRSMSFDTVHVHLPFAANVLATISPSISNRMVYTAHLGETNGRVVEPRFSPDAYLASRAARTIVLNPTMRDAFINRGVQADRLRVIPNGVDITQFRGDNADARRALRSRYGLDDVQVVLFVGSVTPRKGVHELVRAVSQVVSEGQDDTLLIVTGRTDLEPGYVINVEREVADVDLEDHVLFTGFVPDADLHGLYELADVFALPSYEEGSSIAVAEAIASETPVVGTDIDGIAGQIEHGVHGLLSEPGDVDALATDLSCLLEDGSERERMRSAVRERAQELSWSRITDEITAVYQEVSTPSET